MVITAISVSVRKRKTGELWPGTAAAAVQMATNGHCRRAALAC